MTGELAVITRFPWRSTTPLLLDVGAHVGSFAGLFVKHGWRAVCVEPEPGNFVELKQNIGMNPRVACYLCAAGESRSRAQFYTSREHWGIHSLQPWHATHQAAGEVQVIPLSDIAPAGVTLLKVDVEGGEYGALKGFNFDAQKPEMVFVEFCDARTVTYFGYSHHDLVSYLAQYGYAAYVSEWEEVKEYGRRSGGGGGHKHLGISPYPLRHAPAWGNLIFVQADRLDDLKLAVGNE